MQYFRKFILKFIEKLTKIIIFKIRLIYFFF